MYGVVYTGFYFGLGIERLDALANFGKTVEGVVAAKQPEQHRSIICYYNVNGIQYTAVGGGGSGNPDFEELKIGDKVSIRFDEHFPEGVSYFV